MAPESDSDSDRGVDSRDRSTHDDSIRSHCTQTSAKRLTQAHRSDLEASGLKEEQIRQTGHFSANQATAQKLVGIALPGLIFPYLDPFGQPYLKQDGQPFYRIKPDWGKLKTEDSPKYLSPKGEGCRPYFSRLYPAWEKALKSTKVDLWETEGEKKADCGCANGLAVIAFAGVDAWVDRCDRETGQELGTSRSLPELSAIDWNNRRVNQCFDSDIIEKQSVQAALAKRAVTLKQCGARPYLILLPNEIDGSKNGLDDFIVRHGTEALNVLAKASKPTSLKTEARELKDERGNKRKETIYWLNLEEPDSHQKALMAWAVLKERWAFRPSIGWYEWQGTHWKIGIPDEFEADLTRFMDAQQWQKRSSGLMNSVVRELRSRLQVRDRAWSPARKVAFQNGTLELDSDRFIPRHNPSDWITRLRPYAFDALAQCPTWLSFITEAMEGDGERVQLIRAIFRYAVLPRASDRKAEIEKSFDFFGQKGTGKGTTLDVLTNLVGAENIGSASVDTFKTAVGLGQLLDKDLAIDYDASGFLSNIGNYNKVVSNEPVEVKKLYQDTCTTRLGVVVIRAYNAFIGVPDGSEGLDRRLTIIPFRQQPKTIDTELAQKLETELPGIFAWCYSMPVSEMKQRLLTAGTIQAVAAMSVERFEANNPEFRFLCAVFPEGKASIKAGDVYSSYVHWCRENQHQPKSAVKFAPVIQALGCKRSEGKLHGNYYYTIPAMSVFDVAAHLGIVQRRLGDSCRDSSNPCPKRAGDSWGQLEPQSSQPLGAIEVRAFESRGEEKREKIPFQLHPTVPQLDPEGVSTVSKPSPTVPTVSTADPSLSENERGAKMDYVKAIDVSRDWQPKVGDRVEVLNYGYWQAATLTVVPNNAVHPTKRVSSWRAKLDSGLERHVWEYNHLRPYLMVDS
ncbi:MAG: phage/plasmid primase, P4 family [Leptolyngbya sp. BL-A-14]